MPRTTNPCRPRLVDVIAEHAFAALTLDERDHYADELRAIFATGGTCIIEAATTCEVCQGHGWVERPWGEFDCSTCDYTGVIGRPWLEADEKLWLDPTHYGVCLELAALALTLRTTRAALAAVPALKGVSSNAGAVTAALAGLEAA